MQVASSKKITFLQLKKKAMRRTFYVWAACYVLLPTSLYAQGHTPERYASTISIVDLQRHLLVLTSDSLQGRETGEKGQRKAARYLASQFKAAGLKPAVMSNKQPSYYQEFLLNKMAWDQIHLRIKDRKYIHLKNMLYLSNNPKARIQKFDVLLPEQNKNVEMKGKLLAYLVDSVSKWREKAAIARKAGAMGAVVFVKNKGFKRTVKSYAPYLSSRYFLVEEAQGKDEELTIVLPASAFRIFFGTSYKQPKRAKHKVAQITCEVEARSQDIRTENVVAYVEGSTKRSELLIITAHYDHLGVRGKDIYRGADDNASGTSALLEIAEAFSIAKKQGDGPSRNVLFMAMTGEEKGLLGSEYYTLNPLFPLTQTVTNLNVDMIGRIDENHIGNPNYVYLIGSDKLSTELHELSEEVNKRYTRLSLDYTFNDDNDPNRYYYRSDHYNFAKNGIPVIFYFSGVHEDYHKPSDTVDKLLLDKYSRIVKLIFHTAWEVANRPERPQVDKK